MDDIEHVIRRRAYELWEQAGCPEGRSDEFWHAARAEIEGEGADRAPVDELGPPIEEPPEVAFQHGIPVGLPGERIVELSTKVAMAATTTNTSVATGTTLLKSRSPRMAKTGGASPGPSP